MEELEQLIESAIRNLKSDSVFIGKNHNGWAVTKTGSVTEDRYRATFDEAVAKLREWATPKPPNELTITLPFEACRVTSSILRAQTDCSLSVDSILGRAIIEAVAPFELRECGTPKPPDVVMVAMPYTSAKRFADADLGEISMRCQEAIAPFEPPRF